MEAVGDSVRRDWAARGVRAADVCAAFVTVAYVDRELQQKFLGFDGANVELQRCLERLCVDFEVAVSGRPVAAAAPLAGVAIPPAAAALPAGRVSFLPAGPGVDGGSSGALRAALCGRGGGGARVPCAAWLRFACAVFVCSRRHSLIPSHNKSESKNRVPCITAIAAVRSTVPRAGHLTETGRHKRTGETTVSPEYEVPGGTPKGAGLPRTARVRLHSLRLSHVRARVGTSQTPRVGSPSPAQLVQLNELSGSGNQSHDQ